MNNPLILLQGAMGFGFILIYGGLALTIVLSLLFMAIYYRIGKKKYLKVSNSQNELLVFFISLVLGIITALITIALLLGLLLFFFGDVPLD